MSLWIVAYAFRSEAATVAIVDASDEDEAKERAIDLEDDWSKPYARSALERGTVERVSDGLQLVIDAPH